MDKRITWEEFYSLVASNNFAFKLDNGYPLCYFIDEEEVTFFYSTDKKEFEFVVEENKNKSIVVAGNKITLDTTDGDEYIFVFSLIPFKF